MAQKESWEKVLEAGRLLSSNLELGVLLRAITQLSAEVAGAESASLLLLNSETQELYFDVALGLGDKASQIRIKMGQGIAGAVARDKKSLIILDARSDPRWSPQMDSSSGFSTRSILATPLIMKERLMGVVEAVNKKEGSFNAEDARLLEALASQAAVAIENARLFASVKEERTKLSAVFLEMADGALLADSSGKISIANKAARKFLGEAQTLEDALSQFILIPPWRELSAKLLSGPAHFTAERREVKPLILGGAITPIKNTEEADFSHNGSPALLCVFRDETEFKRSEAVKRTFLSFISHKLKTPLAAVIGFADILNGELGDTKISENALYAAKAIKEQGKKLSNIVDKLLRYTALESPEDTVQFEPCALNDVLREALEDLEPFLKEKKARVEFKEGKPLPIIANRLQIKMALGNLIENAAKFDTSSQKIIQITLESNGPIAIARVQDFGSGIPPEDMDKIFNRFHQIEAYFTGQVEGLGLGLPYVKRVAENHGGHIEIRSLLGSGTTASFYMPLK